MRVQIDNVRRPQGLQFVEAGRHGVKALVAGISNADALGHEVESRLRDHLSEEHFPVRTAADLFY
jgi:hypothetical protein